MKKQVIENIDSMVPFNKDQNKCEKTLTLYCLRMHSYGVKKRHCKHSPEFCAYLGVRSRRKGDGIGQHAKETFKVLVMFLKLCLKVGNMGHFLTL